MLIVVKYFVHITILKHQCCKLVAVNVDSTLSHRNFDVFKKFMCYIGSGGNNNLFGTSHNICDLPCALISSFVKTGDNAYLLNCYEI